jgi:hypothetical protein
MRMFPLVQDSKVILALGGSFNAVRQETIYRLAAANVKLHSGRVIHYARQNRTRHDNVTASR